MCNGGNKEVQSHLFEKNPESNVIFGVEKLISRKKNQEMLKLFFQQQPIIQEPLAKHWQEGNKFIEYLLVTKVDKEEIQVWLENNEEKLRKLIN